MREVKQVIVIRRDLKMRRGKECAQAAHASMKVFLDIAQKQDDTHVLLTPRKAGDGHSHDFIEPWKALALKYDEGSPFDIWLKGAFTKICLQVSVEQELIDLYELAQQAKIPCAEIIDSGKTEFHNVPTRTCIAIGPWWSDEIDKITGHLELL